MRPSLTVSFALLMAFSSLSAGAHTIECGSDLSLKKFTPDISQACPIFEKMEMKCGDSSSPAYQDSMIALRSPIDTYYSSRNAKQYDRATIQKAITNSVCGGTDPYFSLAIIMVESPPLSRNGINYLESYGIPPLDGIAGVSALGCSTNRVETKLHRFFSNSRWRDFNSSKNDFGDTSHMKVIRRIKKGEQYLVRYSPDDDEEKQVASEDGVYVETLDVQKIPTGAESTRKTFNLMGATEADGEVKYLAVREPRLAMPVQYDVFGADDGPTACKYRCCAKIIVPKGSQNRDFLESMKGAVGNSFLEGKVAYGSRNQNSGPKNGIEKFALMAQAYNGYGVLGSTEITLNQCIGGLNMSRTPIYGAGVGELMLNSLMGNSEIRKLIADAKTSCPSVKSPSYLCRNLGAGVHQVDARAFAQLQKRYLSGRNCPSHSYNFAVQQLSRTPLTGNRDSNCADCHSMLGTQ